MTLASPDRGAAAVLCIFATMSSLGCCGQAMGPRLCVNGGVECDCIVSWSNDRFDLPALISCAGACSHPVDSQASMSQLVQHQHGRSRVRVGRVWREGSLH